MTMGPYTGKRVEVQGVLYPRYTSVQELLGYDVKSTATPEVAGAAQDSKKRAQPDTDAAASPAGTSAAALLAAAAQAAAAGMDPEAVAILQRKAAKRAKREARQRDNSTPAGEAQPQEAQAAQPAQQPAPKQKQQLKTAADIKAAIGYTELAQPTAVAQPAQPAVVQPANNAEEAARIRAALGYTAPAAPVVQPVVAPVQQPRPAQGQFGFGFSVANQSPVARVAAQVEQETDAKIARIMAVDSSKDGFVPRRVWVCGLPHEYSETQVKEYWEYCGPVESLDLLTFKDSGRFNGAAFVTFTTQEGCDAALAVHGQELEGRKLRVEKCRVSALKKGAATPRRPEPAPAPLAAAPQPAPAPAPAAAPAPTVAQATTPAVNTNATASTGADGEYNVAYVGNIAFEATVQELEALFKPYNATVVRLHTDQKTGRPKGFAHVHFADKESLNRALAADGAQMHGRGLKVLQAQPPKKKT